MASMQPAREDWIGPFYIRWDVPAKIVDVEKEVVAQMGFDIKAGDEVASVSGVDVLRSGRGEILRLFQQWSGELGVRRLGSSEIQQAAREALMRPDPAGPEWIGPLQLRWTSPPTICDVKQDWLHAGKHRVKAGDKLSAASDQPLSGSRRTMLQLIAAADDLTVESAGGQQGHRGSSASVAQEIRDGAQEALRRGASDVDKVGPMRLKWANPPIIEHMSPRLADQFGSRFIPGDRLAQIDDVHIGQHDREDVLVMLKNYRGEMGLRRGGRGLPGIEHLLRDGSTGLEELLGDRRLGRRLEELMAELTGDGGGEDLGATVSRLAREAGVDLSSGDLSGEGGIRTYLQMQKDMKKAAEDALLVQREYDAIGPFVFSWNPCKVVAVEDFAANMFSEKVKEGDSLAQVGGRMCDNLSREEILRLLVQHPGNIGFARGRSMEHRRALTDGARQALLREAPQTGSEWVGPLRVWWRKPATVVEAAPEAHTLFRKPIDPGSWFVKIDGKSVLEAGRDQVLQLLQEHKDLNLESSGLACQIRAGAYLAQFKEEEDPEWLGPLRISWSSPCPTLREVKPEFLHYFSRPPSDGDVVHGCGGILFAGCSRSRILQIICDSEDTLNIRPAQSRQLELAAAALLTTQPDLPENGDVPAVEWVGPLRMLWTMPPTIVDALPQAGKMFHTKPDAGDCIHKVNGQPAEAMTRREVLEGLRSGRGIQLRGTGVRGQFRAAAGLLLAEPGLGAQADWLGPVKLGWQTQPPWVMHTKPEANQHFRKPLSQGDQLVEVDGQPTRNLDRRGVLKLLVGPGDNVVFRPPRGDRETASVEGLNGTEKPESEWVGKFRLLWTKPPTVLAMEAGASDGYQKPVTVGDLVVAVDGVPVISSSRDDVLALMQQGTGKLSVTSSFDGKLRAGAVLAMDAQPSDPEWIGPFQFRWTAPPSLADCTAEAQSHFPQPLTPGDVLNSVDGHTWQKGDRDEVLRRLANYDCRLSFSPAGSFDSGLRAAARAALDHPDAEADQLGPITLQWTDPPTVLWIAESAQRHFRRRVSKGDRLIGASGKTLKSLSRRRILELLAEFDGDMQIAPAECPVM